MLKKLLGWAVVLLVASYVLKNPVAAGATVHGWASGLLTFASSLGGH